MGLEGEDGGEVFDEGEGRVGEEVRVGEVCEVEREGVDGGEVLLGSGGDGEGGVDNAKWNGRRVRSGEVRQRSARDLEVPQP